MGAEFSQFMFKHSIPATAASFSIGTASADMAKTMAADLVLPILFAIVGLVHPAKNPPKFRILPFANSVVVWLCVLVTSYVLMEYVFARGMVGVSTVVLNNDDKKTLSKAREEAAKPLEKAKRAVKSVVGGMTPSTLSDQYAPVNEAAIATVHNNPHEERQEKLTPGSCIGGSFRPSVAKDKARPDFDGTL